MNAGDQLNKTLNLLATSTSSNHMNQQQQLPFGLTTFCGNSTINNDNNNIDYLNQGQSEALANLFKSLSNLAREQRTDNTAQQDIKPTNLSMHHNTPIPAPPVSLPSTIMDNSLASSFQSAVAAALMQHQQQQLQSVNQRESSAHTQHLTKINSTNSPTPSSTTQSFINESFTSNLNQTIQASMSTQQIFQSQLNSQLNQQPNLNSTQNQQRINYCTICNKELCNKYFMKTHMLKMHGINLEIEQMDDNELKNSDNDTNDAKDGYSADRTASDAEQSSSDTVGSNKQSSKASSMASGKRQSGAMKQATSVMNGFAGNAMGGVVCDICNKELCSKYFLKVHKQNTHGIMTDYQDSSQFMYPFANPLAATAPTAFNPFAAAAAAAASMGLAQAQQSSPLMMFSSNAAIQQGGGSTSHDSQGLDFSSKKTVKKARLTKIQDIGLKCAMPASGLDGNKQNQMDQIYRLMLAQQLGSNQIESQTNSTMAGHDSPPVPPSFNGPFEAMGSVAANPMNALMCFGGMTPFGPAGMSPALVVDMILRNQHLFNRKNQQGNDQSPSEQFTLRQPSTKDKNNNNNANDSKSKSGKTAKDSSVNSSKYFSHYTEACPMCDRRFKSIKWLKTHMMNDHKQEINAYMQMMMQYMYTCKPVNQSMANLVAPVSQHQPQMPVPLQSSGLNVPVAKGAHIANNNLADQQGIFQNMLQRGLQVPATDSGNARPPAASYNIMQEYLSRCRPGQPSQFHDRSTPTESRRSESSNASDCQNYHDEIENLTSSNRHSTLNREISSEMLQRRFMPEEPLGVGDYSAGFGTKTNLVANESTRTPTMQEYEGEANFPNHTIEMLVRNDDLKSDSSRSSTSSPMKLQPDRKGTNELMEGGEKFAMM